MSLKTRIYRLLRSTQSVSQAVVVLTAFTFLSKVLGFVRDVFVAMFYGTSANLDAFIASQTPPGLISGIFAGSLATIFIPLFIRYREEKDEEYARKYATTMVYAIAIILSIFSILVAIFAHQVMRIFVPGFSEKELAKAAFFLRIISVTAVFNGMITLFNGILQAKKRFLAYSAMSLSSNIIVITALVMLNKSLGIMAYVTGYVVGLGSITAGLMLMSRRYVKPKNIDWHHPGVHESLLLILPLMISSTVALINVTIDRIFASGLPTGSISALNYAVRVRSIPISLFGASVYNAVYPAIATAVAKENYNSLSNTVRRAISLLAFVMIPITLSLIPFSSWVVRVLFQRGAFTAHSTAMTSSAVIFYAVGMFFATVNVILVRIYYSMKDTKHPVIYAVIAISGNILFNFLLVKSMKHNGLALSTSINAMIFFTLAYLGLRKKGIKLNLIDVKYVSLTLLASVITLISIYAVRYYFGNGMLLTTFEVLGAVGVYLVISEIFGTFKLKAVIARIRREKP